MKGYKVFNPDWTCRSFKYELGHTYTIDTDPVICKNGFHFCKKLTDCFGYYSFNPDNKVAEIEALGQIVHNKDKSCTNKIKIVEELSWYDVLDMVNTGDYNTGHHNTGNYNTGNYNTGNCNTGNYNTGDYNTGHHNTGDCNTGNYNTGDYNTGNCNTGDYNTGNYNTGDYNTGNCNTGNYNTGNYNTGCFNILSSQIYFFDKPAKISIWDWRASSAYRLLLRAQPLKWIKSEDMTEDEKQAHPEHETTGGYFKYNPKAYQEWWSTLNEKEKEIIKTIPNFESAKFAEITGIKIEDIDNGGDNNGN